MNKMQMATPQALPDVPSPEPSTVEDIQGNIASLRMYQQSLEMSYQISRMQVRQAIRDQVTNMKAMVAQEAQLQVDPQPIQAEPPIGIAKV